MPPSAPFGIRKGIRFIPGSFFLSLLLEIAIWGRFGAFLFGDDDPVEFVHLNPDVGIRHVHMDHRRLDVFMPHRFLNGASPEWLGKSAGYSDNRCPASDRTAEESSGGIGCRVPATPPKVAGVLPDQAANFHRNGWPGSTGIGGRLPNKISGRDGTEYAS